MEAHSSTGAPLNSMFLNRALLVFFTKQPITMEQRHFDLTVTCMFPVKDMGSIQNLW